MNLRHRAPRARIPSVAVVVLDGGRWMGPFEVDNLSVGGALLTGRLIQVLGLLRVGTAISVRLELPGANQLIEVQANIVRAVEAQHSTEDVSLAVQFRSLSGSHEDLIRTAVAEGLEASRAKSEPAALILDGCSEDRDALEQILARLGRRVLAASNIVDAIRLLQAQDLRVDVMLIDTLVLRRHALNFDVLKFLKEQFPTVRLVVTSRGADADDPRSAASRGHADATLVKPAEPKDVALAIGLERP